ncbi:MAG TPA: S8 family serine peptidase [Acidobacteriota bacterium]|nr:S8 family serine peptidase [Acidobacteriota bacterium]
MEFSRVPGAGHSTRRYRRIALGFLCAAFLQTLFATPASSSRHTPAAWRQTVPDSLGAPFGGQRKNRSWTRDRDGDFIDDAMPRTRDTVHVVLELNECYSHDYLRRRFSPFGRISHIGLLISCLYLQDVSAARLDTLARMPEVAMVEWQTPFRPIMGVAVRSVQAAKSGAYGTAFARAYGTPKWSGFAGENVNIAILDTGVQNENATLPSKALGTTGFIAGYNATTSTDEDPDADEPLLEHGTRVASIALGRKPSGLDCGYTDSDAVAPDCAGVAPEAGLIDVKVWDWDSWDKLGDDRLENDASIMRGIDWVGVHHDDPAFRIHVVNFSISDGIECDGLCAACQAVNYLAAIGVTPVVGHGNAPAGAAESARRLMPSVAAASYAITVAGVNDLDTVPRSDDTVFVDYLKGPRYLKGGVDPSPLGQKPDLAAPAQNIVSLDYDDNYTAASGTSFATPLVAGAAALLLQAKPSLGPADVKDVLRRTADASRNPSGAAWDEKYGRGILNVSDALNLARVTDLRFASCIEPWTEYGAPCNLTGGLPIWLNTIDLTTDPDPPKEGVGTKVWAKVRNAGAVDATDFLVTFGYYDFGTGTALFHEIETVKVPLLAGYDEELIQCNWTPVGTGHQCLQVSIQYGLDTEHGNNTTQRNLTVAPSKYDVRVENPYMTPAQFYVRAVSEMPGLWPCTVSEPQFTIGGPEDCPKTIQVGFRAPRDANVGDRSNCHVSVYARKLGALDSVLVGGVTVQTYVPGDCQIGGRIVDENGRGLSKVWLTFVREIPDSAERAPWERDRRVRTDAQGRFRLRMPPQAHRVLRVGLPDGRIRTIPVRPECGESGMRIRLGPDHAGSKD